MNTTDLYMKFEELGRYIENAEAKAIATEGLTGKDMMDEFIAELTAGGVNDPTLTALITSFYTNYAAFLADSAVFNTTKNSLHTNFELAITDLQDAADRLTAITRI